MKTFTKVTKQKIDQNLEKQTTLGKVCYPEYQSVVIKLVSTIIKTDALKKKTLKYVTRLTGKHRLSKQAVILQ